MSTNVFPSTGFTSPLVEAPRSKASGYPYRAGLGIMPSAEYVVFHDDFHGPVATNVPNGWDAAIIDTGCTVTQAATSPGVILFDSDAANEGAAIYTPKMVNLTTGKRFFIEVRAKVEDASAMTFQFGLTDLTATTNPEDLWTTVAASFLTFGTLDTATVSLGYDKSNATPVSDVSTAANGVLEDDTWAVLGIGYDGVNAKGYVNGQLAVTSSTTAKVPNGIELAVFVGMLAGHATTADLAHVDYVRFAMER